MSTFNHSFSCMKCKNTSYEQGQFQATGNTLSKLFDVQTEKFITITCTKCSFTEIYKSTSSTGENITDFLFGG